MPVGLMNDDKVLLTRVLIELGWHGEARPGSKELQREDTTTPSEGFLLDVPRTRNQDLYILKRNLLDLSGPGCHYKEGNLTVGVGSANMHTQTCPFTSISTLI